jgi:hypothetical protein
LRVKVEQMIRRENSSPAKRYKFFGRVMFRRCNSVSFKKFLLTLSKTTVILNVIVLRSLSSYFILIESERK